jgi:hypothetical protein
MNNLKASKHRFVVRGAVVAAVTPLALLAGCGSDDDTSSTTTAAAETTSSAVADEFPSKEFCAAQADLEGAQDGAQRNTAIGEMQGALGENAPAAISEALDTLLTGDLSPEQYTEAEQALADACG